MYGIDFVLFMHIDIRQTGRDLVEKCDDEQLRAIAQQYYNRYFG